MQDKLICYLLGLLELEEINAVERRVTEDAEIRRQLELLRVGLVPFDGDREDVDPPADLAVRTCQQIRSLCRVRVDRSDA